MSIRVDTYQNAALKAKQLSARNVFLTTSESTVLGQLLDSSVSHVEQSTTMMPSVLLGQVRATPSLVKDVGYFADDVAANTRDGEEPSIHTLRIQALSEDLAPNIKAHISVARNEVAPLVSQFAAKLELFLREAKPRDPASSFTIVKARIPALCLDESFISDLEGYDNQEQNSPNEQITLAAVQTDEFIERLGDLGNDRLNGLVKEWLQTQPAEYLKKIFTSNFTDKLYHDHDEFYILPAVRRGVYDDINFALGLYLVASRLFAEPQVVPNMTLVDYKRIMREYKDYAGCLLLKSLKNLVRQNEAGTLVNEANPLNKRIVVNADVYKDFLEEGGTPEVLLGMLVSGSVVYSKAAANEQREALVRQWKNYVMLTSADNKKEFLNAFRNYAEAEAVMGLNDLSEFEQEYAATCNDFKAVAAKHIKEEFDHLSHRLTEDLYHTALHAIAKGRYFYTSAYRILSGMAEVTKDNPDADPREAALLSVIDYVAEYLAAQVKVTA